jgi:phosphate acyltransferase
MGPANPRVGLLNIGEEPGKGDELTLETHRSASEQQGLNFIGNIEGRDIIRGACDVVVCDGFVGNVLLKFYESVAAFIVGLLKKELKGLGRPGAGPRARLPRPRLRRVRRRPVARSRWCVDHLSRRIASEGDPERPGGRRPGGALGHGEAQRP